eukprot:sb/3468111/
MKYLYTQQLLRRCERNKRANNQISHPQECGNKQTNKQTILKQSNNPLTINQPSNNQSSKLPSNLKKKPPPGMWRLARVWTNQLKSCDRLFIVHQESIGRYSEIYLESSYCDILAPGIDCSKAPNKTGSKTTHEPSPAAVNTKTTELKDKTKIKPAVVPAPSKHQVIPDISDSEDDDLPTIDIDDLLNTSPPPSSSDKQQTSSNPGRNKKIDDDVVEIRDDGVKTKPFEMRPAVGTRPAMGTRPTVAMGTRPDDVVSKSPVAVVCTFPAHTFK